ncbi:MAG: hypothetical protein SFZ23_05715 [Planctomycetota bacterium]|nr:hypothetical protein [Planctomycetota bacterium]
MIQASREHLRRVFGRRSNALGCRAACLDRKAAFARGIIIGALSASMSLTTSVTRAACGAIDADHRVEYRIIARSGTAAPADAGQAFARIEPLAPVISQGRVAFAGTELPRPTPTPGSPLPDSSTSSSQTLSVYVWSGASLARLRINEQPDLRVVGVRELLIDSQGTVAILADVLADTAQAGESGAPAHSPPEPAEGSGAESREVNGRGSASTLAVFVGNAATGLQRVSQPGAPVPAHASNARPTFVDLSSLAMSDGRLAWLGRTAPELESADAEADREARGGIWVWAGGLGAVATTGERAPAATTPVASAQAGDRGLTFAGFFAPVVNQQGTIAFLAGLEGPGLTQRENDAIWSDSIRSAGASPAQAGAAASVVPGALRLLVRKGASVPGLREGVRYGELWPPGVNAQGTIVFGCEVDLPLPERRSVSPEGKPLRRPAPSVFAIVSVPPSPPDANLGAAGPRDRIIARTGMRVQAPAPAARDVGRSVAPEEITLELVEFPLINARGDILFAATGRSGGEDNPAEQLLCIVRDTSPEHSPDARAPEPRAPEPRAPESSLPQPPPTEPRSGVHSDIASPAAETPQVLVRAGRQIPVSPDTSERLETLRAHAINARGDVAYVGVLSGEPNQRRREGLWLVPLRGEPVPIVVAGQMFDLDPRPDAGDMHEVTRILVHMGSGNGDGKPSGFSDQGELTFAAQFADGSTAVVVARVVPAEPE